MAVASEEGSDDDDDEELLLVVFELFRKGESGREEGRVAARVMS